MPKTKTGTDNGFALGYGALEGLLNTLLGTSGNVVVSRFRKLRPKFAADGLLTDTGNRVSYDLTRVVAICAVYQLNLLSVPQGQAVDVVVANWPEIARASLNARSNQLQQKKRKDPQNAAVRIYIDAMGPGEKSTSWASLSRDRAHGLPHIVLDLSSVVAAISAEVGESDGLDGGLVAAFNELEETFGWAQVADQERPRLPQRGQSDFFGTGPYFERARVLLAHDPGQLLHHSEALRLQAYLDYLEEPAPIDSWKRFIGSEADEPRLVQILTTWGADLGLRPSSFGAEIHKAVTRRDRAYAMHLIESGERIAAELTKAPELHEH